MIIGRYGDTSGRPHIEGRLLIPSQHISTNISFLMDTGADVTNLMPMDAAKMGLDFAKLTDIEPCVGAGGYCQDFVENALAVFLDRPSRLCFYLIRLHISTPSQDIADLPSLLGRDVIDQWQINYDPSKKNLIAKVRTADAFELLDGLANDR